MTNFTASGHQLVTRQRNGKDGRSVSKVDVVYQCSTSATSVPTTWVTTAPKLPKGYYLWSATKVTYKEADGKTTTEVIGAQCIASADNLKTTVERYAQTTSRTTPPDNSSSAWQEGDTSGVQAKDGYYTWTQTKIVWQDGTITYTTPICITGDKGNTGKDGTDGKDGCIQRVTEWASGIEFHNDEELTSGTRFLDIAVITESATSFKAYKCLKTHISSSSNAPQAGVTTEYWEPFNSMAPIYTPMILAENGLIRLAQSNQVIVTDKDNNVSGGMQGDTTLPIIWAGSTTASNGTFRVMADGTMYASKGVFSGTLDGVSGTFESLADKSNKCKIGFQDNGFFFTGYTRFYDSIDVDGDINQQGGGIFYTSNVYCRGVLGSRNRTIAVIDGRQITVYPNGYEQPSNKKTGTLTSATKDGKTVYNIELYSPLTGDGISGMPIDIVIFAPGFSGAELYYQLTGAVGKKVTLLSSKDKAGKIYVAFADGWNLIQQGGIVEAVYIGDLMTPASTKISGIGNGWMHGQMIDNTWA